jgi:DNA-binding SARP family transcriptional activator
VTGLKLKLLGQMECGAVGGATFSLSTRKAEVLLAYLALAQGVRQPRERLINLLWSDRSEDQARNSLRQTLSVIKKKLESINPAVLEIERTTVRLDTNLLQVDSLEFEALCNESDNDSLSRAFALYQGEFLEGITVRDSVSQDWLANTRDRFGRQLVEVLIRLGELHSPIKISNPPSSRPIFWSTTTRCRKQAGDC